MDLLKKYWWIVALFVGAVGAYLAFQPTEKEAQLAKARQAKADKAAAERANSEIVDVDYQEEPAASGTA